MTPTEILLVSGQWGVPGAVEKMEKCQGQVLIAGAAVWAGLLGGHTHTGDQIPRAGFCSQPRATEISLSLEFITDWAVTLRTELSFLTH